MVTACGSDATVPNSGFDWPRVTATTAGLDTALLRALETRIADSFPNMNALVIVRGGAVAWEWYRPGADTNATYDTHSVTKSAIATFVGQAIHEGLITSLDQPITELYPSITGDDAVDPRFRAATVRHLLGMTSGLENELTQRVAFSSADLVPKLTRLPLLFEPGAGWHYDMANSHLLSGILSRVRHLNVGEWAATDLFARLNITHGGWQTDHESVSLGWTGLELNARDLAKLGELYLRDGVWQGERVLPAGFAAQVAGTVNVPLPDEFADYALHWWTSSRLGTPAWIAAGFRHQYIMILPERDAVIVMQSESVSLRAPVTDHFTLFPEFIIPSLK